jgi:hypothetical protein
MVLVEGSTPLRLADVLVSCHLAMGGRENPLELSGVTKAAVLVVDGLGAENLRERAGHARWLMGAWSARGLSADSGFPSTTASALTSLTTGVSAGEHGIVGYTIRDPASRQMVNHLKQWQPTVDPDSWQRSATVFERALESGIPSLALGEPRFTGSDFTRATWRGAQFVGVGSLAEQGVKMREFFDHNDRGLAYLYWPALDRTGHGSGVSSDAWIHRLEELDSELEKLHQLLKPDEGLIVTSDHGMIDIPSEHKLILAESSPLLTGVIGWAGEPRAPQLYFDDTVARDDAKDVWSESLGSAARIMTREQIIDEEWMGPVHQDVRERLGDLVIACVESLVVYRESISSPTAMAMVGQHGSLTSREREIPIIPLGAWA